MNTLPWLPLTDYSIKYKVSVSTLRRKIKAEDLKFRLQDGKYYIEDEPIESHPRAHRPSQVSEETKMASPSAIELTKAASAKNLISKAADLKQSEKNVDEPVLTAANKLLNELKKAYSQILQEKEEQILQLKEEVTDLKTLVRVLESENARLNN